MQKGVDLKMDAQRNRKNSEQHKMLMQLKQLFGFKHLIALLQLSLKYSLSSFSKACSITRLAALSATQQAAGKYQPQVVCVCACA